MELKPPLSLCRSTFVQLLIAPYGIETIEIKQATCVVFLLIAPYGIETGHLMLLLTK